MRELVMAAEGRSKADWNHTASLLCLIANVNRGKKTKAFKPTDFHPHASRAASTGPKQKVKLSDVKQILMRTAGPTIRRESRPRPRAASTKTETVSVLVEAEETTDGIARRD